MSERMTDRRGFEVATCSRCAGTGRHSYCQQYGDTCFKCGGTGRTHTKRGEAALLYFRDSRRVPVCSLKEGDKWFRKGVPGYTSGKWATVTIDDVIEFASNVGRVVKIEGPTLYQQRLAAALAYQETLTMAGTVRKRVRA